VEELQESIMEWHSCSKGIAIPKNKLDKALLKPRLISVCGGWRALISKVLNNTTAPLAREACKEVQMALDKDGIAKSQKITKEHIEQKPQHDTLVLDQTSWSN
jgi:hypothetical protein